VARRYDVAVLAELVRTRPRLAAGTQVTQPAVTVLPGREVTPAGEDLVTCADEEAVSPLPATSVCVPGALGVLGAGPRAAGG
jgi:diacylglycerol kinase (ATP)